ncbi:MAG: hypothetical protein JJT78_09830 [Leptospira sp.]|nr:hypothetical protein [Leptospira sp.]
MSITRIIIIIFLILEVGTPRFIFSSDESNKATQLIRVSQGLKENYHYLKSIGSSVSNYGDEIDEKLYTRSLQHHIETEILHLQMDLGKAYEELRRTQELTIQLYYRIIEANIKRAEQDLIHLTKVSSGKRKTHSYHYLQMGFREIAIAKAKLTTAKNTHPQLFLMKLQDSSYALRSLKQAQKYIIRLAILHDGVYESEEDDTKEFSKLKMEITRVLSNDLDKYMRYHYDANFTVYDRKDIFEDVWNNPNLHELANPLEGYDKSYIRNPEIPKSPKQGREAISSNNNSGNEEIPEKTGN